MRVHQTILLATLTTFIVVGSTAVKATVIPVTPVPTMTDQLLQPAAEAKKKKKKKENANQNEKHYAKDKRNNTAKHNKTVKHKTTVKRTTVNVHVHGGGRPYRHWV